MIVSQCELLATLVFQVEDQLRVLAVFACEDVFSFENGGVEGASAIEDEDFFDDAFDVFATEHLTGAIVSCALMKRDMTENGKQNAKIVSVSIHLMTSGVKVR